MIWLWIALAVVVLAAGALVPVLSRARREDPSGAEITARGRYELLGSQVEDLPLTEDEAAAALLRQARERWNSAGALLADARRAEEFRLAERTAEEGLADLAAARARLSRG
jgi:uncharacterized SAM-binding protein YcdF (DUF218 family)